MAVSAQVVRSDAYNVKKVEKAVEISLTSGAGTLVVNLDDTFLNDPTMLVIKPLGTDAAPGSAYTPVYDLATPKITITVATEDADLSDSVVRAILIAYDQP